MKEARRDNEVMSVYHMIRYIWEDHEPWWRMYLASQRDETAALANLARMCRRLAYAFGFSRRRASSNKLAQQDLEALQATFAASFWERFEQWPTSHIVNCDETGIFLDMPPRYILAERGQSAAINADQKNSARITAVLAITASGTVAYKLYTIIVLCGFCHM